MEGSKAVSKEPILAQLEQLLVLVGLGLNLLRRQVLQLLLDLLLEPRVVLLDEEVFDHRPALLFIKVDSGLVVDLDLLRSVRVRPHDHWFLLFGLLLRVKRVVPFECLGIPGRDCVGFWRQVF